MGYLGSRLAEKITFTFPIDLTVHPNGSNPRQAVGSQGIFTVKHQKKPLQTSEFLLHGWQTHLGRFRLFVFFFRKGLSEF